MKKTIREIITLAKDSPKTFEEYLSAYAEEVGDLIVSYIPTGSHPDMGKYLYDPLVGYSKNGGKRHRPLICFAACRAVG
ncbi:MAG: hypothetical protein LBB46_03860, partial [Coriobacteriaceae bacterium]|nr:hypothetical protein [Coriobacteriaceae bacterium]